MLVPRCPNCSYVLVLLERRLKYKCSKCGRLFPKREVEDRGFRIWNKAQRKLDRHNLKLERKKPKGRPKLPPEEKKKRIRAREEEYKPKRKENYGKDIGYSRRVKRIQYYRDRQRLLVLRELELDLKRINTFIQ